MPEKFTRKELRGPDAFQKAGFELRQWLQERQRLVALIVLLIFLGGAGAAVASYVSSRGEAQAAQLLGVALRTVERPVGASDSQPERPHSEQPFESQQAKDEALVKELSELAQKYPRSRAALTAMLPLGQAQLRLARADQALASLQAYLKGTPADEPLRAEALEGQGYAYELQGQLDQALASFDQLARDNQTEFLSGIGLYHRARILMLQNKKEDAAQVLSQIPVAYPNSAAARMASERMAELTAQGVKVPTPAASSTADAGSQ